MDREQEVIHKQMEGTRADLTNKLAALESQVSGTVQTATNAVETTKEAVTDTVDAVTGTVEAVKETVEGVTETMKEAVEEVKESVQETFHSVAETFNLKHQAERHPWAVFGGAVAVGCLGGFLLGGTSRQPRKERSWMDSSQESVNERSGNQSQTEQSHQTEQGGGVSGWLWQQLGGLKGLAVGSMMSVVRDLVSQALPDELKERVTEEVDKLTTNLGGQPLKSSFFQENQSEAEQAKENAEEFRSNAGSMWGSESNGGRQDKPAMAANRR